VIRRDLLALFAAALALCPSCGVAQAAEKVWRVGFLDGGPEAARQPTLDAFRRRMAELGYAEGSSIAYESRYAAGHFERLPALARELIALSPDALLVATTPAAAVAKAVTATIPVVIVSVADPVGTGLVRSVARPGGNITGVTNITAELAGKRLEIIKEIVPAATRIAVLINPDDPNSTSQLRHAQDAARSLKIELRPVAAIRGATDIDTAFEVAVQGGARAGIRMVDPLVNVLAQRTAAAELQYRLPVIHAFRGNPEAGSLVSYGTDAAGQYRQAADLMSKILKGAMPADLPLEQPAKFELVINMKTAKALGRAAFPPRPRRRGHRMRRRDFLSAAAAGTLVLASAARAQRGPIPVIGFLSGTSPVRYAPFLTAFRDGLREDGFVEGQNLAIEYRWADGAFDRLPTMAADLVRHRVDVIVTSGGTLAAVAAKNATDTIPTVFIAGDDPVALHLVRSLARPDGNRTGISFLVVELNTKRFELLCELLKQPKRMGLIVNPANPAVADRIVREVDEAARRKGVQLTALKATSETEIDAAVGNLAQQHVEGLLIGNDAFFNSQRERFVGLTARFAIPASYESTEAVKAGGLTSYGADVRAMYRELGHYTAKVLNGIKPADLPVQQPTKFELAINLKTAAALGLTVPQLILQRADEVIE
jgi:putative tryptophan/tyrosine transport system substrate-binding protein